MRRPGSPTALDDEIARFQAEIQRLALAAVRAVIGQELARRRAEVEAEAAQPRRRRSARRATRQLELGLEHATRRQLELPLAL